MLPSGLWVPNCDCGSGLLIAVVGEVLVLGWRLKELGPLLELFTFDRARTPLSFEVVTRNQRLAEIALQPWTPVFIHGDLHVDHIFVAGGGVRCNGTDTDRDLIRARWSLRCLSNIGWLVGTDSARPTRCPRSLCCNLGPKPYEPVPAQQSCALSPAHTPNANGEEARSSQDDPHIMRSRWADPAMGVSIVTGAYV